MTTLALSSTSPATLKADAVVVGIAVGPRGPVLAPGAESLAAAFGKGLLPALVGLGATGAAEQVVRLATLGAVTPKVLVAVGLGPVASSYDPEVLRRAAGAAVRGLDGTGKVSLALPATTPPEVAAVGEGALLGAYRFDRFRTNDTRRAPVTDLLLCVADSKSASVRDAAVRAEVLARAVTLARDLVNTPPSHLRPKDLAEIARSQGEGAGLTVEVLDEKALKKGGYGGLLGVGAGSSSPPRLVHLSYRGPGATQKVALVGKGITFDSGGLSLKPAAAMEEMKMDMGGAAAVLATLVAVAELGLAVDVEGWLPLAENMPSGTATRPSDVLTMHSGTTVEVNNTDAEGRLVLADAISRAGQDAPDLILDIATLTGAALVALGARTTGVMSNDDDLRAAVVASATRAGEPSWGMPLPADLRKGLDSEVADLVNTGPREGGMLTAGLFLQEFVPDGVRWAHLDIAGPAYNSADAYGYTQHGGTGAGVRTFVALLEDLLDGAVAPAS